MLSGWGILSSGLISNGRPSIVARTGFKSFHASSYSDESTYSISLPLLEIWAMALWFLKRIVRTPFWDGMQLFTSGDSEALR